MDRRTFLAAAGAALVAPLSVATGKAPTQETRRVKILDLDAYRAKPIPEDDDVWRVARMKDLKKGDVFQLVDPDGTLVENDDGFKNWVASEEPVPMHLEDGSVTMCVQADPYEFPKRVVWGFTDKDGNETKVDLTMNFAIAGENQKVT